MRNLHAERGGKAVPQCALVPAGDQVPRLIHGESVPGSKTDLRDLVNEVAVVWKRFANRIQPSDLRLNYVDALTRSMLERCELPFARRALREISRQCINQGAYCVLRVAMNADIRMP